MPTATTRPADAVPTLHPALDLGNTTWMLAVATAHAPDGAPDGVSFVVHSLGGATVGTAALAAADAERLVAVLAPMLQACVGGGAAAGVPRPRGLPNVRHPRW